MLERLIHHDLLDNVASQLKSAPSYPLSLTGIWGSASAMIAAALGQKLDSPVLFIADHLDNADATADDIELFLKTLDGCDTKTHLLPAWEAQLADDHLSDEVTGERLRLLSMLDNPQLADEKIQYIIAPIMALLQPVPSKQALRDGRLELKTGMVLEYEDFLTWLTDAGYTHVDQVDQQGEYASRGGIVDVFQPGSREALRFEFFGDELESIRKFDLDTQRSTAALDYTSIASMSVGSCLDTAQATNFFEYIPADTIICCLEPGELRDLADKLYDRIRDDLADDCSPVALRRPEEIFAAAENFRNVSFHLFAGVNSQSKIRMGVRSLERLSINTAEAMEELNETAQQSDVWVFCENQAEQDRFRQLVDEQYHELADSIHFGRGHIAAGFHWPALGLTCVGHSEIYQRYSKVRRLRRVRAGRPIQSMLDLNEGDYVVHVAHGIAKFDGLRKLGGDDSNEEFLKLKFSKGAVMNVPIAQINLVQKYIGAKGHRPSLSTLGGSTWAKTRDRVTEAVKDLAAEMLRLQAMRETMKGTSYPKSSLLQRQFADEFIYTETDDQITAINQIDADMVRAKPMDRLVCGDVGYGKTEVAMRAAFKTVEAGKQVAVLVPTTVLADQHYRTFTERFADFAINIEVLSRFRTAKQQKEVIKKLALGQVDILIGTHRLLSKDVEFPELGLVIIDEEQRFGVAAKEHLKNLRASVDILTLSATPIPRTLHMSLLGLRDISSLQTPPLDRRAIHTEVCRFDEGLLKTAIHRELNRDGQIYIIHNRVQDIEKFANHIRELAGSGATVAIGHGQMSERSLEKVMLNFTRGQTDILVSTTIIESGVDIPSANTMIIHEADRFGLAELHQLRGRVGRYKHRAFCYLLLPERRSVSPIAARRLKAIEDFSDLGAGFQIAMRDLELRGAGNILGPQQSGNIAAVGYELYCQLLEGSVNRLKGKEAPPELDVHVDLGIESYIPRSYMPSSRQRMETYRRMVGCKSLDDIEQLRKDLTDAYGPVPTAADQLIEVATIRILAAKMEFKSIMLMKGKIIFNTQKPAECEKMFQDIIGSVSLVDNCKIHWTPPREYLQPATLLRVLIRRLSIGPGRAEKNSQDDSQPTNRPVSKLKDPPRRINTRRRRRPRV